MAESIFGESHSQLITNIKRLALNFRHFGQYLSKNTQPKMSCFIDYAYLDWFNDRSIGLVFEASKDIKYQFMIFKLWKVH